MASLPELRVFVGDAVGRLQVLYTQSKKYDTMEVPGCKYGAGAACQLLACGMLGTESPMCVVRAYYLPRLRWPARMALWI